MTAASRPTAARGWFTVVVVVLCLAAGAWGVTRFVPPPEGIAVGQRAPDYKVLRVSRGDSIGVRSGYSGFVTLINIWATWCVPCRTEMPSMEQAYRDYKDRGLRIAAVSIDDGGTAGVAEYARTLGLTFDILHDRSGFIQRTYQSVGVPQSILIDRSGRITYLTLGPENWVSPEQRTRIEHLLAARN